MWLVIFGLVCFWSGLAALIANLFGGPVILAALVMAMISGASLILALSFCKAAAVNFPEDRPIDIQAYFGGTFVMKKSDREAA